MATATVTQSTTAVPRPQHQPRFQYKFRSECNIGQRDPERFWSLRELALTQSHQPREADAGGRWCNVRYLLEDRCGMFRLAQRKANLERQFLRGFFLESLDRPIGEDEIIPDGARVVLTRHPVPANLKQYVPPRYREEFQKELPPNPTEEDYRLLEVTKFSAQHRPHLYHHHHHHHRHHHHHHQWLQHAAAVASSDVHPSLFDTSAARRPIVCSNSVAPPASADVTGGGGTRSTESQTHNEHRRETLLRPPMNVARRRRVPRGIPIDQLREPRTDEEHRRAYVDKAGALRVVDLDQGNRKRQRRSRCDGDAFDTTLLGAARVPWSKNV